MKAKPPSPTPPPVTLPTQQQQEEDLLAASPEATLQNALGSLAPGAKKGAKNSSHRQESQVSVAQAILDRFASSPWVSAMISRLGLSDNPQDVVLDNLANPPVKLLVVASVFQKSRKPVVFLSPDPHQSEKYADELSQYLDPSQVELYPTEDVSPYDLSIPAVRSLKDHYRILERLAAEERFVLILSPKSLLLKHPSLASIQRDTLHLKVRDDRGPSMLAQQCLALGYVATSLIMDPGEFSSRGDIFDLCPVNSPPVRIEFFGDTIESIRVIDIENQRSVGPVSEISAIPRSTVTLTAPNREKLLTRLNAQLEKQRKQLSDVEYEGLGITLQNQCQALNPGQELSFWPDGIDYYAPLTSDNPDQDFQPLVASFNLPNTRPILIVDDWAMLENNLSALGDRLARQAQEGIEKGRLLDLGFIYHLQDKAALTQLKAILPNRLFLDTYPLRDASSAPVGA